MAFTIRSTRERRAKAKTPSVRIRHERFSSSEVQKTLSRATVDPFEGRRTMRTWMRTADGSYITAKIDLETGEVVPHPYSIRELPKKVTAKTGTSEFDPPWVTIPPPDHGATEPLKSKRLRKQMLNPLRATLRGYSTLEAVFSDFPYFENIFFGALMLDMGGNTRTLSPALVLALLQNLKIISSETIQCFMGCGVRHAEKVALTLRVMVTAFVKERENEAASGIYRERTNGLDDEWTPFDVDEGFPLAA
jgi:hypothetical protein